MMARSKKKKKKKMVMRGFMGFMGWNIGSGELGLGGDRFGSDDWRGSEREEEEEEDDDDDRERERLIRDMDSSSPESSFGLVMSNERFWERFSLSLFLSSSSSHRPHSLI
ncbi:uncharacterized protein A4U43_C01F15790 [Asparagus officinalis]|uniref:Uncharacterized protein n=1 Tax=Asparagus officinalis TaxID=4686 RepID=A0A5P1FUA2_ASPOF|nr:uncharacterized protein A4U43_C01F15790 [Asparagus officinalis]